MKCLYPVGVVDADKSFYRNFTNDPCVNSQNLPVHGLRESKTEAPEHHPGTGGRHAAFRVGARWPANADAGC